MPLVVLLSPIMFILGSRHMCEGDATKGLFLLGMGVLFMFVGIVQCNIKNEK